MKKVILLIACCVLASSCATTDRLTRAWPWGETSAGEERSPDRVNLWPLFYHDNEMTSVLWPLMDFDDRGFALRPLIAKDDHDWSLLYPLCGWSAEKKAGWVGPVWWDGSGNHGLFPLYDHYDGFTHIGPVWWDHDLGGHGLFPLYYHDKDFTYIGPVWWDNDYGSHGLFPLYFQSDSFTYIGPLWWNDEGGHGLFPLYAHDGEGGNRIVNFWWSGEDHGLFPLYGRFYASLGQVITHIGPIWWCHSWVGREFGIFPLLYYNGGKEGTFWLFPVYRHKWDKGYTRRSVLLGILADYKREGDSSHFSILQYLYRQERKDDHVTRDIFPFIKWDSGPEKGRFSFFWRLLSFERNGDRRGGHILFIPWGKRGE